ncbi:MAG: 50S ribosomal protein L6 [uncultured bacterium]|nr:MAG: 50S ribosomal protein L6 [uncultured bacterium]OGH13763.1 MAG: 50S ribosomal protein L6 [Candidatus Levybacteria bacterium RIFCSPHIGHO2_01_FULL_38_26]
MSKLAKIPIVINEGTSAEIVDNTIKAASAKGALSFNIPDDVLVKIADGKIVVSAKKNADDKTKVRLGLTRSMIANMVKGVSAGFSKQLELSGVGYRAQVSGDVLTLSVGFSHPVKITAPGGISFTVSENVITILGIDKELVGNTAANIRRIRPPEPYKGKGIKYVGERIRRKAGKAAKALGAK